MVCSPNSVTHLKRMLVFEWCVDLRTDATKTCVCKEIGLCAQNFVNHSRLNSQHNWGPI